MPAAGLGVPGQRHKLLDGVLVGVELEHVAVVPEDAVLGEEGWSANGVDVAIIVLD